MIRRRFFCMSVIFCLLFLLAFSLPIRAQPEQPLLDRLGGVVDRDPLRIDVFNNGNLGVFAWDETFPGSVQFDYVNRYFDDYCWGTILFLSFNGTLLVLSGDALQDLPFTADPLFILQDAHQERTADETTVTTLFQLPEPVADLVLQQVIRYLPGSTVVEKSWTLYWQAGTLPGTAVQDLTLYHGGDVFFYGEGRVETHDDSSLTVAGLNFFNPQQIVFAADAASPWDQAFAGDWLAAGDQVAARSLAAAVSTVVSDVGCFIGWNRAELAAGDTWTVTTREDYGQPATPTPQPSPEPTPQLSPQPSPEPSPQLSPQPTGMPTSEPTASVLSPTPDEPIQTGESAQIPFSFRLVLPSLAGLVALRLYIKMKRGHRDERN